MQEISSVVLIALVGEAVEDVYSGYDFHDYRANTSVQVIVEKTN